ncbi:porin family protein [Flammeovirga sp. MY04]|uniref:outer membrane beta-barrel protein n=1 Tax=Flammeovirga sp. MY04 TaxID=1191459 RepID=UPI0008062A39|nr:outer membrane beta-barrel protein [Flammeovirga sp. MY04]ANQ50668.1 porin family protein [Flammeovirga sp. MY04]
MQAKPIFITLILVLLQSTNLFSQVSFQSGYYINLENDTVSCYIKNLDWRTTPQKIQVKKNLSQTEHQVVKKEELLEFEIYGELKYIKATVPVDRTSQYTDGLSDFRKPDFKTETILLKELFSNTYSLYLLSDKNIKYFYYKDKNNTIQPLVFKEYYNDKQLVLNKNLQYQQDLYNLFEDKGISSNYVKDLSYSTSSLRRCFQKFDPIEKKEKNEVSKKSFRISIRPGLSIGNYIDEQKNKYNLPLDGPNNYGTKLNFKFGVELEKAFSANHYKWRIYAEPSYRSYSSAIVVNDLNISINYQSFLIPIGLRYYSYLKNDWAVYYNVGATLDNPINSYVDHNVYTAPTTIRFNMAYHLGIGLKHNEKWGTEFRYTKHGSLIHDAEQIDRFKAFEINLIYTIN